MIDDEIIEIVDEYQFLGWLITTGNEMSAEINKIITKWCVDLVNKKVDIAAALSHLRRLMTTVYHSVRRLLVARRHLMASYTNQC